MRVNPSADSFYTGDDCILLMFAQPLGNNKISHYIYKSSKLASSEKFFDSSLNDALRVTLVTVASHEFRSTSFTDAGQRRGCRWRSD